MLIGRVLLSPCEGQAALPPTRDGQASSGEALLPADRSPSAQPEPFWLRNTHCSRADRRPSHPPQLRAHPAGPASEPAMFFLIAVSLLACKDKPERRPRQRSGAGQPQHQDSVPSSPGDTRRGQQRGAVDVVWDEGCNPFDARELFLPLPHPLHQRGRDQQNWAPPGLRHSSTAAQMVRCSTRTSTSPTAPSPHPGVVTRGGRRCRVDGRLGRSGEDGPGCRSVALIHAETGESVPILEMDQANREQSAYDDRHPLIPRPLAPMEFGARYFAVITRDVLDRRERLRPAGLEPLRDGVMTSDLTRGDAPCHDADRSRPEAGSRGDPPSLGLPVADQFVLGPARASGSHQQRADLATVGTASTRSR